MRGASENNRRAKYYGLTREENKVLRAEIKEFSRLAAAVGRVLEIAWE